MPASSKYLATALTLLALSIAGSTPARAGLTLAVENSTAPVNGTGSFDVVLSDVASSSGPTSFQVAFFSLELSVAGNSGVTFTTVDANTTAAGYIFGTLQSNPFSYNTFPNTDFTASDSPQSGPGYATLNVGQSYGLAHVTYSVAPGTAPGPVTVSIDDIGGTTYLNDLDGNDVPFDASNGNGTITVTSAAATVPEPASIGLVSSAIVVAAGFASARRRIRSS